MSKLLENHGLEGRHVGVSIESDEIEVETDELVLLRKPAEAARAAIAADIRAISEPAKEGDHRLFNKTGTLAKGITVHEDRANRELDVVAPPDRLEDPAVMERLIETVPSLRDPLASPDIEAAIADLVNGAIRGSR